MSLVLVICLIDGGGLLVVVSVLMGLLVIICLFVVFGWCWMVIGCFDLVVVVGSVSCFYYIIVVIMNEIVYKVERMSCISSLLISCCLEVSVLFVERLMESFWVLIGLVVGWLFWIYCCNDVDIFYIIGFK